MEFHFFYGKEMIVFRFLKSTLPRFLRASQVWLLSGRLITGMLSQQKILFPHRFASGMRWKRVPNSSALIQLVRSEPRFSRKALAENTESATLPIAGAGPTSHPGPQLFGVKASTILPSSEHFAAGCLVLFWTSDIFGVPAVSAGITSSS